MGNLSGTREKNIINCGSVLLQENNSINEINKVFPYTICTVQDLYDVTSLKNGINIDLAAELICDTKNVKIITSKDEKVNALLAAMCESLKILGIQADLCSNITDIKEVAVFLLTEDLQEKCYEYLKVINILPEKKKKNENISEIQLYHIDCTHFGRLMCLEILLNCLYLGVLACINK